MSATLPSATAAAVRRPRRTLRFARDEELVRLLRVGDERAFEALYDRHHRGILSFARHMLGSREEAEDAVQHTFIAAHKDLAGSDKPIQLKAWLYAIARNRCLSILRARKDERALDDVPEPAVEGLASEVQRRQDLRDMLADLHRLPEDQRAALVLSELGALSHDEIGTALGVRKDKVKALVFQARESLASSREARDADCHEIQEQLAVLRGGALRRTQLRRHVDVCPACTAFKAEVQRQRSAMACLLPVVPTLALKESVLVGAGIAGGVAGGGGGIGLGGGLLAASSGKALVAKVATVAVVAGGATGGGLKAVDEISTDGRGGTATAMAGVPEQRAVKMVGDLRRRARSTAAKRESDRRAAGGGGPTAAAPAGDTGERRDEPTAVAKAPRRRPERRSASSDGAEGGGRTVRPASDPTPSEPVSAPAPAPKPAPAPAPAPQTRQDGGDDRGKTKHKRAKKHGKKHGKGRGRGRGRGGERRASAKPPKQHRNDDHGQRDAEKQQRDAEKQARKQQREAEKQQRDAEKQARKQQHEAEKQQRDAEKRERRDRELPIPAPGRDGDDDRGRRGGKGRSLAG